MDEYLLLMRLDILTNEPYAEIKESLAGFIIIKAKDFDEAVSFARECPLLKGEGNTVEVRKVVTEHHNC